MSWFWQRKEYLSRKDIVNSEAGQLVKSTTTMLSNFRLENSEASNGAGNILHFKSMDKIFNLFT